MDTAAWNRARDLFYEALDLVAEEREQFLDERCGDDVELRAEVEQLITADESGESFLDGQATSLVVLPSETTGPAVGGRLGPFVLKKAIASGGMGMVFEAEQERPRRKVALKTLRAGFWTPDQVRRFRTEVDVLGMLQHPGIAQIYEAGTHEERGVALPYFAMELVPGARTILEHANENGLDLRARLRLFLEACEAVHYGHTKGVIHRDLKPGNVLVDQGGRVKVIDFGLARVVDPTAASVTLSFAETQTGHVLGTLPYMSPEHLTGSSFQVDVQSDVYSLGCLLHELLTGRTPIDPSGLPLAAALMRVERGDPDISTDLPRDLRWILARALERSPKRRYPSVAELTVEIGRFLRHETVLAGAPSATYRLMRFARRNRTPLVFFVAVVVSLSIGLVRARSAYASEKIEKEKAESERQMMEKAGFVLDYFVTSLNPLTGGRDAKVIDVIERMVVPRIPVTTDPRVETFLKGWVGQAYLNLRQLDKSEEYIEAAWERAQVDFDPDSAYRVRIGTVYADLLERLGRVKESAELSEELLPIAEERFGLVHDRANYVRYNLAICLTKLDDPARAEELLRVNLAYYEKDPESPPSVLARKDIGAAIAAQGRLDDAVEWYEETLLLAEEEYGPNSPAAATVLMELAGVLLTLDQPEGAEALLLDVEDAFRLAPHSPQNQYVVNSALTTALLVQDKLDEAEARLAKFAKAVEDLSFARGEPDVALSIARADLARRRGAPEADALATEALQLADEVLHPLHATRISAVLCAARVHMAGERWEEADDLLSRIEEELAASVGPDDRRLRPLLRERVEALRGAGRTEEADELAKRLDD